MRIVCSVPRVDFNLLIMLKTKEKAIILAILFGWMGGHKFYLGEKGKGILYLLFFWTAIPCLAAIIEAFVLILMPEAVFNQKYNGITPQEEAPLSDKDKQMRETLKAATRKAIKKGLLKAIGLG